MRHRRVKHFQKLAAMTLPHTNVGRMSRLYVRASPLLYASGCRSQARIRTVRAENRGER